MKCNVLQNGLMQQRLAHLYFVTVLEHLTSKNHGASHLVRLANKTTEVSAMVCIP